MLYPGCPFPSPATKSESFNVCVESLLPSLPSIVPGSPPSTDYTTMTACSVREDFTLVSVVDCRRYCCQYPQNGRS